jgi:hypothetical protein
MLFLLNEQIVDVAIPEIHLSKRWKVLGCGDPASMRAREALEFVARVVSAHVDEGVTMEVSLVEDLAALIIAKTGRECGPVPGKREARRRSASDDPAGNHPRQPARTPRA